MRLGRGVRGEKQGQHQYGQECAFLSQLFQSSPENGVALEEKAD